jgi:hypothetical protein
MYLYCIVRLLRSVAHAVDCRFVQEIQLFPNVLRKVLTFHKASRKSQLGQFAMLHNKYVELLVDFIVL